MRISLAGYGHPLLRATEAAAVGAASRRRCSAASRRKTARRSAALAINAGLRHGLHSEPELTHQPLGLKEEDLTLCSSISSAASLPARF